MAFTPRGIVLSCQVHATAEFIAGGEGVRGEQVQQDSERTDLSENLFQIVTPEGPGLDKCVVHLYGGREGLVCLI